MHDPGRNIFNNKDCSTRNDYGGTSSSSSGNVSNTADTHRSYNRDRDNKPLFTASNIDPVSILCRLPAHCLP